MSQRRKEGATLALTVTGVFFIILLGVGFFFLVQLLGGGREAQHATDAGNLNVAKTALIKPNVPGVNGPTGDDLKEFDGLFPPSGNSIDLVDYNRFVGKAFLVAMNASEENTPEAFQNAQRVLNQVEGPNGIGDRLCQALSNAGNTDNFFTALARSNSLRMLNWNNHDEVNNDQGAYKVGFMRRFKQAPTNLQIYPNSLPAARVSVDMSRGGPEYKVPGSDNVASNLYLVGYTPVTVQCNGGDLEIWGVPVRPGQQPHLVSQDDFGTEADSPFKVGGRSMIPPNAFQSQSSAPEMHGANMLTRSSAIVGSLATQYDMAIPHGYIVIDNTGQASNNYNNGDDIFAGELMNGVYMVPSGHATDDPAVFDRIKNATPDSNGNVPVSQADRNNIQPAGITQSQLNQLHDYLQSNPPLLCNNRNSFTGHPLSPPVENDEPTNQGCVNALHNHQALVNSLDTAGGGAGGGSDLMAIEFMKAEIIRIRGMFGDDGCGSVQPPNDDVVTGLKVYPHGVVGNDVHFGRNGTLYELLQQTRDLNDTNSPSQYDRIVDGIVQRMQEMNPKTAKADIDPRNAANIGKAPWNQIVAFNTKSYIYFDKDDPPEQGSFKLGSAPWAHGYETADGAVLEQSSLFNGLSDVFVNNGGDGGFPHPFDCPPDFSGFTKDILDWRPSSGYQNLLGVMKFSNHAKAGVTWCCPC